MPLFRLTVCGQDFPSIDCSPSGLWHISALAGPTPLCCLLMGKELCSDRKEYQLCITGNGAAVKRSRHKVIAPVVKLQPLALPGPPAATNSLSSVIPTPFCSSHLPHNTK
ncbi:unnamed protein product [Tuber melanosporum]|uniref:(Perigord truffle) hypothetical protein n=1 Tax=Tuber melanosporum (strain Mel28) TaxID=656061 RepID=D5GPR4_TUBMM|nr:uncharacterized protein GSTUM_00011987001 [Tuber melanosporum]CAZ86507.1 unnamed protein product [Tuber melanosporum]